MKIIILIVIFFVSSMSLYCQEIKFSTTDLSIEIKINKTNDSLYQELLITNESPNKVYISLNDYNSFTINEQGSDTDFVFSYVGVKKPLMKYPESNQKVTYLTEIESTKTIIHNLKIPFEYSNEKKYYLKFHVDYVTSNKDKEYTGSTYFKECVIMESLFPIYFIEE